MIEHSNSFNLRSAIWTLVLVFLISIFQPFIALFGRLGVSSKCLDCGVWDDTFLEIIVYLVLPIFSFYIICVLLKINKWLYSSVLTVYFVIVSFLVCTVPLFQDRIASWSTFSDEEIFSTAILTSFIPMGALSAVFLLLMVRINSRK